MKVSCYLQETFNDIDTPKTASFKHFDGWVQYYSKV